MNEEHVYQIAEFVNCKFDKFDRFWGCRGSKVIQRPLPMMVSTKLFITFLPLPLQPLQALHNNSHQVNHNREQS